MIANLVRLVHSANKLVVIEGVETLEQLQRCRAMGCDVVQGFFFSEPLLPEQAVRYKPAPLPPVPADLQDALREDEPAAPAEATADAPTATAEATPAPSDAPAEAAADDAAPAADPTQSTHTAAKGAGLDALFGSTAADEPEIASAHASQIAEADMDEPAVSADPVAPTDPTDPTSVAPETGTDKPADDLAASWATTPEEVVASFAAGPDGSAVVDIAFSAAADQTSEASGSDTDPTSKSADSDKA